MLAYKLTDREITDRLWRRGCLTWKLHGTRDKPGQKKIELAFVNRNGKLFVLDCARRMGKSFWCAIKVIETMLRKPGANGRYATAFRSDLEQFIIPAFEFALLDCPEELRPKWNASKYEYTWPNGSKCRLVGLDLKPNGLRGNKLDVVVLDEAGYMKRLKYLYASVIIPATANVKNAIIIMASTQPESPDHDFVYFCDRAQAHGAYVQATIWENPLLRHREIDELAREVGGYQSTSFRREFMCERVVEEGRALIPEFKSSHVVASPVCAAHKFWHRIEALDSGVRDMTACIFGYYDFARAKLCIEGEFAIKGPEVTTPRINELVRQRETELGYHTVYRRIADNNNLILIQDLGSQFNLHFAPTDKDELYAMVNKVRVWFQTNRIEVHPRCERLIGSLKAGIWDVNRKEFARSEVHGHYDLIAALMYMVRNVPEWENPVPHFFGHNPTEVVFQPRTAQRQDQNGEAFRQAFRLK